MPARKIYCKHCGKRAFRHRQNSRRSWGQVPTIRSVYVCSKCQKETVFLFIEEDGQKARLGDLEQERRTLQQKNNELRALVRENRENRDKQRLTRQIESIKRKMQNLEYYINQL